jgi:hypothetical protein
MEKHDIFKIKHTNWCSRFQKKGLFYDKYVLSLSFIRDIIPDVSVFKKVDENALKVTYLILSLLIYYVLYYYHI